MRGSTRLLSALFAGIVLGACGGGGMGGSGRTPGVPSLTLGGSLSGLGSGKNISLQLNGGDALTLSGNGAYSFVGQFPSGFAYSVAVLIQPVGETCLISNPIGNVGAGNVANILVNCSSNPYSVGGTISGLTGSGGALQNNAGDDLALANGPFTFDAPIADSSPYAVTVSAQPTGQTCTVNNGMGTVTAANVANVVVVCSASAFTVGGASGSAVVLQNNGADDLAAAAGAFAFAAPVASGAGYSVTVLTPPAGQACSVANGSGTIGANVTNVVVTCAANVFSVGGTVSGLSGTLVLQNNGGDSLSVSTNQPFTFATALADGSSYAVTILAKPAGQTCLVANGSGTLSGANVGNVAVSCGVPDLIPVGATFSQALGLNMPLQARVSAGNDGTVASAPAAATVRLFTGSACSSASTSLPSASIGVLAPSTVTSALTPATVVSPGIYPSQALTVGSSSTLCLTAPLTVH